MGKTLAIFKTLGYSPVEIARLNNFEIGPATMGADMIRNFPGKSSLPVDFLGLILSISF